MNNHLFFRDPAKNVVKTTAIVAMLVLLRGANLPNALAASADSDSAGPDNTLFTQVLRDYVNAGVVNYRDLKADQRFADYITLLQKTDPNAISKENRLAFWINVYNCFVLKIVCDEYPIKSILSKTAYELKKSNFHKYGSGVLEFCSRYLPAEQGQRLRGDAKTFNIKYHDYNWDLNE